MTSKEGPLANARLEVFKQSGSKHELYTVALTDKDGRYQLSPENGNYTIRLKSPKGETLHTFAAYVKDNEPYINKVLVV